MKRTRNIYVTKSRPPNTFLLFIRLIKILITGQYTNDARNNQALENRLSAFLQADHVVLMENGTSPISFLLSRFPSGSKILTTPFSFVATSSSIVSLGHVPVFVDIDEVHATISVSEVSKRLKSGDIAAMLFTHVYGEPCDFVALERLSKEYSIPLYFDGAHALGVVLDDGRSLLNAGHASTVSFHATKILSTGEGGALITNDPDLANQARAWRNFGIESGVIRSVGLNAKMAELPAALGLVNLRKVKNEISRRKRLFEVYRREFEQFGDRFLSSPNGSYFPLVARNEEVLFKFLASANSSRIFPRRYFYPSLNTLSFLSEEKMSCPASEYLASRVVCLPSGHDVSPKIVKEIARLYGQALLDK